MITRKSSFIAALCVAALVGLVSLAGAADEVFLSNDTAQSEATYVVQFEATVKGNIDKIKIKLPPGANAGNAVLGRVMVKDKVDEDDGEHKKDVKLSVDPLDSDTLVVDLHNSHSVKPGTEIRVELFNLNNPVAGNHAIDVTTVNKKGNVLEVIPPIAYSTFPVGPGDITAVNAGTGLTGGGTTGDVTLNVDTSVIQKRVGGTCPAGSSIQSIDATGNVVCQPDDNSGGTVTSGMVSFFYLATCPTGWTELVAARGRYLVGLPASGTLAGTVGAALNNNESRPTGGHSHSVSDSGHNHRALRSHTAALNHSNGFGSFAHTGITMTGDPTTNSLTGVIVNSAGIAGTNAPYLQLLVCLKD